jgi:hypothetical protein
MSETHLINNQTSSGISGDGYLSSLLRQLASSRIPEGNFIVTDTLGRTTEAVKKAIVAEAEAQEIITNQKQEEMRLLSSFSKNKSPENSLKLLV